MFVTARTKIKKVLNNGEPFLLHIALPFINYLAYSPPAIWCLDNAVTNHITLDISNLNIFYNYKGSNKVFVANGHDLDIANTSSSSLLNNSCSFKLTNSLHVPLVTK